MKKILLLLLLLAPVLVGCQEEIIPQLPAEQVVVAGPQPVRFTIPQGAHYATASAYQLIEAERLQFKAMFDSSAIYSTQLAENQADINKLYGLADCTSHHHTNSARFGWCWNKEELQIWAYAYVNGKRVSELMGAVALGSYYTYSITPEEGTYVFRLQEKEVRLPRACNGPLTGYKLFPYFGGNETAPQDISVWIIEE